MRRGGTFAWPPTFTGYAWEALQGATLQAELAAAGRVRQLGLVGSGAPARDPLPVRRAGWAADGDDEWQPWLIDRRYGTSYRAAAPAQVGKNFGYTDWLYAP